MHQTRPHHQLCEDDVELLRGGHGQVGLQGHHYGHVIMAVSDLWLVVVLEATRKERGQTPPLRLLYPCNHDDLQKQQSYKHIQNFF